jgi:quinoprotein glucose dehydrogenase
MNQRAFHSFFRMRHLLCAALMLLTAGWWLYSFGQARKSPPAAATADWPAYGRDAGGSRYAPLAQINRDNVKQLKVAWTYRTGDMSDGTKARSRSAFQVTPILVDGTLYLSTPFNRVIALDPETGAERWTYDPKLDLTKPYDNLLNSRGVSTWLDPQRRAGQPCRRRILMGTNDARLIALDAATGQPCADFGEAGQVNLAEGVGIVRQWEYAVTSPPAIINGLVIVGSAIGDNQRVDAPSGVVRAYDARTGKLRWSWEALPPGAHQAAQKKTEGEPGYRLGTANVWAIISADPERDLVFLPTGNTSPDYYGGERKGIDYYSSSVVALRASTGKVAWHFQTVHHDVWDYDVPAQPALITVRRNGRDLPAVAVATKMGHLFLLHRETGKPIFPVEERKVPQDGVPGEQLSPTQPFPTLPRPLVPDKLAPEDAWGLTEEDRNACREQIKALRAEGVFTPPSLQGTLTFPGDVGGMNWSGVSFDPQRGWLITNTNRFARAVTLIPRKDFDLQKWRASRPPNPTSELASQTGTPYVMHREFLLRAFPRLSPCNPPPWGTLLAIDLATGAVRWEVPLGVMPELAQVPDSAQWGSLNLGGSIVTSGGLIFIGAARDNYLRAFDVETGKELWKGELPAGGQATPMTYRLREGGKQYVVIAAGGHSRLQTKLGDYVVAFALP